MKRFGFAIFALIVFSALPVFALSIPKTHLVSATWLAQEMSNPHLVIVDVRSKDAYDTGHIPNSINITKGKYFQKSYIGNVLHILNTPRQITKLFRTNGISNNSVVVFYNNASRPVSFTAAAREFWTAWMYGLRKIAILHGGINAWVSGNRSITKTIPKNKRGNFTVRTMSLRSIATWPNIYSALATHRVQLVDLREAAHYKGTSGDPRLLKHGHIPGAIEASAWNFTKKVGNHFEIMNRNSIKTILRKAGISLRKPIITYCNTGHLASGGWFVIKFLAGAKHIRMYDGSMYEYTRMPLPVVK